MKKETAKVKAQAILMDKISIALAYWVEETHRIEGMTELEIKKVSDQMKKQADRIAKMFEYDEAWISYY